MKLERNYLLDAPKGVRGRNSDNTRILELFGWEPSTTLRGGPRAELPWVYDQVAASLASGVSGRGSERLTSGPCSRGDSRRVTDRCSCSLSLTVTLTLVHHCRTRATRKPLYL